MGWLPPSFTGSLIATLIMVAISFFLYQVERQRCLALWGWAWVFFTLRVSGDIVLLYHPGSPVLFVATHLSNLGMGLFLALGSLAFLRRAASWPLCAGAALAALLLLVPLATGNHASWTALPIFIFIGVSAVWTGAAILGSPELDGPGGRICGIALILWGLHRSLHPLLGEIEGLAPLNYLLATLLTISVAVGLMLAYYQRAKHAQRFTEISYRQLLDSAKDSFYVAITDDQAGPVRFIEVNRAGHERLGYTREEFLGLTMEEIVPERERSRIPAIGSVLLEQGYAAFEGIELTKDGREIPVEVSLHQTRRGQENVTLSISRDISLRKQAQARLNHLAAIVENSEDCIIGLDPRGVITSFNRGAQRIHGYSAEEAVGRSFALLLPGGEDHPDFELFRRAAGERPVENLETALLTKDGSQRDMSITISPLRDENGQVIGASAIGRDVTDTRRQRRERQEILEQLRQSQKMEALGTLAGGIAHDFNNLLGVIMGRAEMAQADLKHGEPPGPQIQQIATASKRARELVRQILTFSRRGEQERKPVLLGPLVAEALRMIRSSIPTSVAISSDIADSTDCVLADSTQMQQVLLNLCANADQAMRPAGGRLAIALRALDLDQTHPLCRAGHPAGPYFLLEVSDTGHGMPEEVVERALEPFFTTKPPGQGTGLGLSVVHGIVQSHGGWLRIRSQLGKGSTFEIWLPRQASPGPAASLPETAAPLGHERILLVDDDPDLCFVMAAQMEGLGYQVTSCVDPQSALALLRQGHACDLLFTDLIMPGLSGQELIRQAVALIPDLPVIICTGRPQLPEPDPEAWPNLRAVLAKPATLEEMALAMRQALSPPA
jgi:PAS domain S-box-containing protein